MNCQRFENVVSELARGQMMAAEQRGEALAHSETCDSCAARLRDEEMLTRGLQSLAAEMETLGAPAAVESKLLEAFRNRHVVTPIAVSRRSNSRHWAAAIAAMLLTYARGLFALMPSSPARAASSPCVSRNAVTNA